MQILRKSRLAGQKRVGQGFMCEKKSARLLSPTLLTFDIDNMLTNILEYVEGINVEKRKEIWIIIVDYVAILTKAVQRIVKKV